MFDPSLGVFTMPRYIIDKDRKSFQTVFKQMKVDQVDVMPTSDMRYLSFIPENGPIYMVDMMDVFKFLMEEDQND